jgi:hypothetical protein
MNIDPNMMQAVLGAGENDPQADILRRQQAQVNAMRQRAGNVQPGQMAGRVFVPNIGGAIAGGVQGYQANQMQPKIDQGMADMGMRNVDAKKRYLDALMMGMRKQYPQQQQPVLPPDGMEDR